MRQTYHVSALAAIDESRRLIDKANELLHETRSLVSIAPYALIADPR